MLTKNQLYLPLLYYNIYCKFGFILLNINCRDGTLEVQKSNSLRKPWIFFLLCTFARGALALLKLLEVILLHESMSMAEMPMLICQSYGYIAAWYIGMHSYIDYGHLTCSIFNALHTGHVEKSTWRTITVQEILVLLMPPNTIVTGIMLSFMFYMHPNAAYNMNSSIPENWQGERTLAAIVALEMVIMAFCIQNISFIIIIMMLFLQKCIEEARYTAKILTLSDTSPQAVIRTLRYVRQLQLHVLLYNQGYAFIHFISKVSVLTAFIDLIAFGVLLIHRNSSMAFLYIFFGIDITLIYCTVFHKAFKLPILVNKIKRRARDATRLYVSDRFARKIVGARIRAVPMVSIKVGNFHSFEKMSTPNFLAFGIKNIIRILIAHSRT